MAEFHCPLEDRVEEQLRKMGGPAVRAKDAENEFWIASSGRIYPTKLDPKELLYSAHATSAWYALRALEIPVSEDGERVTDVEKLQKLGCVIRVNHRYPEHLAIDVGMPPTDEQLATLRAIYLHRRPHPEVHWEIFDPITGLRGWGGIGQLDLTHFERAARDSIFIERARRAIANG